MIKEAMDVSDAMDIRHPIIFQTPEANRILSRTAGLAGSDATSTEISAEISLALKFISLSLTFMAENGVEVDISCSFNARNIGVKFLGEVESYFKPELGLICILLGSCYRFIVEYELKSSGSLPYELNICWHQIADVEWEDLSSAKLQLRYAHHHMAIHVLREYLTHPGVELLKDLPAAIRLSEAASKTASEALASREERIQHLSTQLKDYQTQFNFLGLVKGFSELRKTKEKERKSSLLALLCLAGFIIAIPLLKIFNLVPAADGLPSEIGGGLAALALEVMIVYFFRITLQNFRSIKAQILQFDLRLTLCQFIESYVDFAKEARKDDKELLVRFEQVIFSGIASDESSIPSTFDGLEQITSLIQKLKS